MSSPALHIIALLAYIGAAVLYGAHLALKRPHQLLAAHTALIAGLLVHTAGIGAFCVQVRQSPFASHFGTLSVAAWSTALVLLGLNLTRRIPALGTLAMPVACLLLAGALMKARSAVSSLPVIETRGISLHILLVLSSFALFAMAACCAAFYVWQYRLLKHPTRRALFRRLPPLETVDQTAYQLVVFALPLLTLGLGLGIMEAMDGRLKGTWALDPHFIASMCAWLVYAAYMYLRTVGGWRGTRPNYLLLAGLVLTISLLFLRGTVHRFT